MKRDGEGSAPALERIKAAERRRKSSRDAAVATRRSLLSLCSDGVKIPQDASIVLEIKACSSSLGKGLEEAVSSMALDSDSLKLELDLAVADCDPSRDNFEDALKAILDMAQCCSAREAASLFKVGGHEALMRCALDDRAEPTVRKICAYSLFDVFYALPTESKRAFGLHDFAVRYAEGGDESSLDFACEAASVLFAIQDADLHSPELLRACRDAITNCTGEVRGITFAHACRAFRLAARRANYDGEAHLRGELTPSEEMDERLASALSKTEDYYALENVLWAIVVCGGSQVRLSCYPAAEGFLRTHPDERVRAAALWYLIDMPSTIFDRTLLGRVQQMAWSRDRQSVLAALCLTFVLLVEDRHVDVSDTTCVEAACMAIAYDDPQLIVAALRVVRAAVLTSSPGLLIAAKDPDCQLVDRLRLRSEDAHEQISTMSAEILEALNQIYPVSQ